MIERLPLGAIMSEPKYGWMRSLGLITSIPFLILISVGIGLGAGVWIDGKLGTKPWFTVILLLVGLAAGLYESAKMLIDVTRNNGD
jgi:ATP synthase protein I